MSIGENIVLCRERVGMTQSELAKKTGVSRSSIQLYERGEGNITVGNLEKIAKALRVTACSLMSPNMSPNQEQMSPNMSPTQGNMSPNMSPNIQSIYNKKEQEIISNLRELDEEKQELHYLRIAKDALETRLYNTEQANKPIKNSA